MSSIILSVGQCGNQIGHELMTLMNKSDVHPLAHRDGKLRYICVDSESKVTSRNYQEDKKSSGLYRVGNIIAGQKGRGNNWALGYYGLNGETEETSLLHMTMETVRKEVERCDNYAGSIVVHSLAGGTGSGLGSHLVEKIRETYPLAHVLSVAIAPHMSGDCPLQHYNSLLSLASLQCHADGVLLYSNDDVLHHVTAYTGFQPRQTSLPSISFKDMNSYIAASLAGVLQPLERRPQKLVTRQRDKDTSDSKLYEDSKSTLFSRKSGKMSGSYSKNLDTISRMVSFDESFNKFSLMKNRSSVSAKSIANSSVASFTSHGNLHFSEGDFESLDEMSRQPRSSPSALLRYSGLVNGSSTNKKTSNSNSCQSARLAAGVSAGNEPWEMLRSLCSEPSTKFASIHHIVKSKVSWESLTQSLLHSIRRYDKKGKQFSTISSLLIARGDDNGSFAEFATKIEDRLRTSLKCVEWNPFPVDFWLSQYNPVGPTGSQSLTLCRNSSSIVETLENVTGKARAMYHAGAYLHWFWKHGCSQDDFLEAFRTLDSVVADYEIATG